MIQGDIHASRVIKDKGEQFQQEVADRLLEVRQGFTSQDVQSCRMRVHGEDITLSPAPRQVLPITVECKAQKKCRPHKMKTGAPSGKGIVSTRAT